MAAALEIELPGAPTPREVLAALPEASGARLLDACGPEGWGSAPFGGGQQAGSALLCLDPEVEFRGGLEALAEARRWLDDRPERDPLEAILIGSLSYDLGRAFERIPTRVHEEAAVPPVCLAGFRAAYRYDPVRRLGRVRGSDARAVARLAERVRAAEASPVTDGRRTVGRPRALTSDADYRTMVRRALEWIAAGDIYQVNLSRRLDLESVPAESLPLLYRSLTDWAGAPFSAYIDAADFTLLSNSPERFLRVQGRRIETCPIKGTRPRGSTPEQDTWLSKDLQTSAKDLAEHLMIVDLERNDLGRLCEIGSVRVRHFASLRSYATVHHLVSAVQGELARPLDWQRLLAATFPGGSISGAPKIRAMEIIETLEPVRRGPYTGAFGYFDAAGDLDLAIAIRTAVASRGRMHLHLGGGIVADSDPEAELRETRDKGRAFDRLWRHAG